MRIDEGDDRLPFMAMYGNPALMDDGCRDGNCRDCVRRRADGERSNELARALQPEDIRWLNSHGWDGRFGG